MAVFRSRFAWRGFFAASLLLMNFSAFAAYRGMVDSSDGLNEALLVRVGHGLPGLDKDVEMATAIAEHESYQFKPTFLAEAQGTAKNVGANLTQLVEKTGSDGTFFFYYTGHGSTGSIYLQDGSMPIAAIRSAMEKGRAALGPMKRLVLMFDSCYSGSLLDPVRDLLPLNQVYDSRVASALFADAVVEAMTPRRDEKGYWEELFVFASSRADETSLAGQTGSRFTVALKKAFDEVIATENATLGDWVAKTQEYTKGHHPVARFAPQTLENELMLP